MIEIWLFGWRVLTLPSAPSVVILIVALTSVTYLSMTLIPALALPQSTAERRVGVVTALGALVATALGLRVGGAGSAGELIPTLAVSVAGAAACGSAAALAALSGARAAARLGAARSRRGAALEGAKQEEARRLEAARRA